MGMIGKDIGTRLDENSRTSKSILHNRCEKDKSRALLMSLMTHLAKTNGIGDVR